MNISGNSKSDLLLAKLCGHGSAKIMISSGHALLVRFITTGSNTGSGVRFTFRLHRSGKADIFYVYCAILCKIIIFWNINNATTFLNEIIFDIHFYKPYSVLHIKHK